MSEVLTIQERLRHVARISTAYSTGQKDVLNFAANCLDAEAAKIAKLEAELASVTALHASAIADGLAMAKRVKAVESNLAWIIDNVGRDMYNDPFEREGIRQDAIARLEGVRRVDVGEIESLARFNAKYRSAKTGERK